MSLLLWIFSLSVILLALRAAAGSFIHRRSTKLLLMPGVLVAIASRSLACGLARAKLVTINLPWRRGEPVEHGEPPARIIGMMWIAILPILAGWGALLLARSLLPSSFESSLALPPMRFGLDAVSTLLDAAIRSLRSFAALAGHGALEDWRLLLLLYFAFSILIFASPTYREWKFFAGSLVLAALVLAFLDFLGMHSGFLSRGWFIKRHYSEPIMEGLGFLLLTAVLSLVAVGLGRALLNLARAALRPRAQPQPAGKAHRAK